MWEALTDLAVCLERMADGECEPRFYLSSLDPGVGKTQTVIHFLRALLASPRHADVGVLLCMFSLQEIEQAALQAQLDPRDFAVLTSDDDLNALGAVDPTAARVLFTTQQRVQKVCTNRKLQDVASFMFKGAPRRVRIWDESLLPAEPVTVGRDDVAALFKTLRRSHPGLVDELETLFDHLRVAKDHTLIDIPDFVRTHGVGIDRVVRSMGGDNADLLRVASDLWHLSGKNAVIRLDGYLGGTLVGYREVSPPDLAPVVILDASGRVRAAYDWWEKRRGTLTRLKSAAKHYGKLRVHLWAAGGGETSFSTEEGFKLRRDAIVAAISTKPTDPWLVVCHKRHAERLREEVMGLLTNTADRVHFIHWGIHRATNEYRNVPNVILAGTQFYRQSAYEAIGRAAANLEAGNGSLTDAQVQAIALGEHQHGVLQALCRVSVRQAVGNSCPPCDAYIIASERSGIGQTITRVFPGCKVTAWEPAKRQLGGYVGDAVRFILEWFDEHPGDFLPFQAVMKEIGLKDASNFSKRVRKHPDFLKAMKQASVFEHSDSGSQRPRGFFRKDAAYFGFTAQDGYDSTEQEVGAAMD